jgi:hypothetical protein
LAVLIREGVIEKNRGLFHEIKHDDRPSTEDILRVKKLFDGGREYFCEFNLDGLQRGDFASRIDGFTRGIQGGVFTPNEARSYMNLPPVEGGDRLYIQGATVPIELAGTQAQTLPATVKKDEGKNVDGN